MRKTIYKIALATLFVVGQLNSYAMDDKSVLSTVALDDEQRSFVSSEVVADLPIDNGWLGLKATRPCSESELYHARAMRDMMLLNDEIQDDHIYVLDATSVINALSIPQKEKDEYLSLVTAELSDDNTQRIMVKVSSKFKWGKYKDKCGINEIFNLMQQVYLAYDPNLHTPTDADLHTCIEKLKDQVEFYTRPQDDFQIKLLASVQDKIRNNKTHRDTLVTALAMYPGILLVTDCECACDMIDDIPMITDDCTALDLFACSTYQTQRDQSFPNGIGYYKCDNNDAIFHELGHAIGHAISRAILCGYDSSQKYLKDLTSAFYQLSDVEDGIKQSEQYQDNLNKLHNSCSDQGELLQILGCAIVHGSDNKPSLILNKMSDFATSIENRNYIRCEHDFSVYDINTLNDASGVFVDTITQEPSCKVSANEPLYESMIRFLGDDPKSYKEGLEKRRDKLKVDEPISMDMIFMSAIESIIPFNGPIDYKPKINPIRIIDKYLEADPEHLKERAEKLRQAWSDEKLTNPSLYEFNYARYVQICNKALDEACDEINRESEQSAMSATITSEKMELPNPEEVARKYGFMTTFDEFKETQQWTDMSTFKELVKKTYFDHLDETYQRLVKERDEQQPPAAKKVCVEKSTFSDVAPE